MKNWEERALILLEQSLTGIAHELNELEEIITHEQYKSNSEERRYRESSDEFDSLAREIIKKS